MNKEIKEKWITALKSGDYAKGINQLKTENYDSDLNKTGDSYCCLGVLCDLYHKETGRGMWFENKFIISKHESEIEVLPETVMSWAGLKCSNPNTGNSSLAEVNDDYSETGTFQESIQAIKQKL